MSVRHVVRTLRALMQYRAGAIADRLGYLPFAAARYRAVINLRPDYLAALHQLAWVELTSERFTEALGYFEQYIDGVPWHGDAQHGRGICLQKLGRHEEAIEAFKIAWELLPNNPTIQFNLAAIYGECGRKQDALALYRRVVRLDPGDTQAMGKLGATLAELGHWEDALVYHMKAMCLEPNAANSHNLGVTLFELDRFADAERTFRRALEFSPDDVELKLRLCMALAEGGKPDEALPIVSSVVEDSPNDLTALATMTTVLVYANQFEAAIETGNRTVNLHPTAAWAHESLGFVHYRRGDWGAALRCYERAIALDPQSVRLSAQRGAALSQLGRHSEAIESFNHVMETSPAFFSRFEDFEELFRASQAALRERI